MSEDDIYRFSVRCYPRSMTYHRWRGNDLLMVVCDQEFPEPLVARVDGGDPGDEDDGQ